MWDFAEGVVTCRIDAAASRSAENLANGSIQPKSCRHAGQVQLADAAQASPLPDDTAAVWFTDPPYYDAIPYADLSDFFFVWLKRALPATRCCAIPSIRRTRSRRSAARRSTTKPNDVDGRPKDRAFFEK